MRLTGGRPSTRRRISRSSGGGSRGPTNAANAAGREIIKVGKPKYFFNVPTQNILNAMCPVWEHCYESSNTVASAVDRQGFHEGHLLTHDVLQQRIRKLMGTDLLQYNQSLDGGDSISTNPYWSTKMQFCGGKVDFQLINQCNNTLIVTLRHFISRENGAATIRHCWEHDMLVQQTNATGDPPTDANTNPLVIGNEPIDGPHLGLRRKWVQVGCRKGLTIQPGQQFDTIWYLKSWRKFLGDVLGQDPADTGTNVDNSATVDYVKGITHAFTIQFHAQLNTALSSSNVIQEGPGRLGFQMQVKEFWRRCPVHKAYMKTEEVPTIGSHTWRHFNEVTQNDEQYDEDNDADDIGL